MFYTRRGDDGYTDLLGGPRVAKYDVRPEALGALDEASAALGLARATAQRDETRHAIMHVQRDLYLLMADIATIEGKQAGKPRLTDAHVAALEQIISDLDPKVSVPKEFVASGDTLPGATLDVARTVVRRAERVLARLLHDDGLPSSADLTYINRLSSLLFGLARFEDAGAGVQTTIAKHIQE
ncbi:MAG TPA: cob(I)yrinic acid a,c-diamide adenosyltransferase [Roseiflexaceae bacterium]|jgi:cob(I)alamin adenosyltransferase|nr:cob(I)yrinic acid a,c-diamide adenosyltransferase [Roseiflexaceae bacterium]